MFDDEEDTDLAGEFNRTPQKQWTPPDQQHQQQPQQQPQQSYNNQSSYNNNANEGYQKKPWQGGNNNSNGGGGGGFQKKPWNGGDGGNKPWVKKPKEEFGPIEVYKPYAFMGNRDTPPDVLETMKRIATKLNEIGYTLRSDGGDVPGNVLEAGEWRKEVHLPWKAFNEKTSTLNYSQKEAYELAKLFHPAWDGLKPAIQAFMARNARVVLGKDLKSPVMFMVCWSQDGAETLSEKSSRTGNVGHPLAIAAALGVCIFNLAKPDAETRLLTFVKHPNPH